MRAIKGIIDMFRRRRSRLTLAAILLLASALLLGAGLAGLLMGSSNGGPVVTNVGQLVTNTNGLGETPTATPLPTPPPSDAPPARMIIEKIGIDAPIITLGLDENFVPQVPDGPYDVAWYDFSSKPGWGSNAVFSGHVDWTIGGRPVIGVFYHLHELGLDEVIKIVLEDGTEYQYKVVANQAILYDDPQALAVMAATPEEIITLITCGGAWVRDYRNPLGGNYTHRQIVQAKLIEEEEPPPIGLAP